jgi:hypothetical protein
MLLESIRVEPTCTALLCCAFGLQVAPALSEAWRTMARAVLLAISHSRITFEKSTSPNSISTSTGRAKIASM